MVSAREVAAAATAALTVAALAVSGLVKDDLRWSMATGWVSGNRWPAAGGSFRTGIVSTSGAANSTGEVSTSRASSTGGVSTSGAGSTGGVNTSRASSTGGVNTSRASSTGGVNTSRASSTGSVNTSGAGSTGGVNTSRASSTGDVNTSGAGSTGGANTSRASSTGGVSTSGTANSTGEERGQRKRRQIAVAIPPGAVIGVIPKFGWLLYEGDNNEELDFRVETEFLYHFPHAKDTGGIQTDGKRRQYDDSYNSFDSDGWYAVHRQKRMVRDKTAVYKGLVSVFRSLGLEGEACLLKTICEITHSPLLLDGLVGELLNIALIPSHTVDGTPDELDQYREAERFGTSGHDCRAAYSQCPISLFRQLDS